MGGLIFLAVSVAAARSTVVTVHDPERLLGATPKLVVMDPLRGAREFPLRDDGVSPDERAGDRRFAATLSRTGASIRLDVVGTDGTHYRESVSLAGTDGSAIAVRPTARGTLLPVAVVGAGPPPEGSDAPVAPEGFAPVPTEATGAIPTLPDAPAEPVATPVTPTAATTSAPTARTSSRVTEEDPDAVKEPWRPNVLLGLWGVGLAVLGWSFTSVRRTAVPAHPMRGLRPDLPGRGLVLVTGDPDKFIATMAKHFRVVVAGRAPTVDVPAGMVFIVGPGRVQVEDVAQAVRGLEGRGPPVIVVVTTGRLEAGGGFDRIEHTLPRLERALPAGTHCFVFTAGPPRYRVDDAGELVEA
ncbi:MAG: hypothetical protein ACOZNI_26000 [Myxococcota bacterium]